MSKHQKFDEFTILELAQKVLEKVDNNSKLAYKPLPGDDPSQRRPDIALAKEKLNWEPQIRLDEWLDKTIPYFAKELKQAGVAA